jgi:hypothetical protein
MEIRKLSVEFEILRLTVDNFDQMVSFVNGSIKGTRLPPIKREIEYRGLNDEECRICVGDVAFKSRLGIFHTSTHALLYTLGIPEFNELMYADKSTRI